MLRQAVCVILAGTLVGSVCPAQDLPRPSPRLKAVAGKGTGESSGPAIPENPTPRQMQNFLWRTLVMKDLLLR